MTGSNVFALCSTSTRGVFEPTEKKFSLKKVQKPFLGETYKSLTEEDRRRLDDSILHATIVHQDQPSDDDSSIYEIFERLNTGGVRLSPQEIRTCIYHGELVDLLRELNNVPSWRAIYGPPSSRMRDQELILRFLALRFGGAYVEYMAAFLNMYAGSNRHLHHQGAEEITRAFTNAIDLAYSALSTTAFRPRGPFNAAVFDAVMVGLARRLEYGPVTVAEAEIRERYDDLLSNPEFVNATETGTAHQESVEARLARATEAFASVE